MVINKKTASEFNAQSAITFLNPSEEERAEAWAFIIDNDIKVNGWMEKQRDEIIKNKIIVKQGNETIINWNLTKKIN